jgi:hypothetical protein
VPEYSVTPYQGTESTDNLFEFAMSILVEQDRETAYWDEAIEVIWGRRHIRDLAITIVLKEFPNRKSRLPVRKPCSSKMKTHHISIHVT